MAITSDPGGAESALPESSYRGDIQGLRAVAVLLVVLNHVGLTLFGGGYVGVDVFFVVSGFLITTLLLRDHAELGRIRFLNFYSRRARRILPAAALTLVATDVAALLLLNYVRARSAIEDSMWAAIFAANVRFEQIGADYFATSAPPSPILHFWSLAVEEQFYLVWPALLGLLLLGAAWISTRRRRGPVGPWVAAGGLLVIIGASLWWAITQTRDAPTDAYFSPFTRAWELGAGAILAIGAGTVANVPARLRAALSWLGLAGILLSAVWFTDSTPFPGVAAILPVGSTVLVVAGGTGKASRIGARALLGLLPFRFVGDVSYGFYLWHWPFLIIAAGYSLTPLTTIAKVGLVAAAFATAVLTYFLYENPIRRARRLWGGRGRGGLVLWPASVGAVVLVGLIGLNSLNGVLAAKEGTGGVPSPTSVQATPSLVPDVAGAVAAARANAPLPTDLSPPVSQLFGDLGADLPGNCIVRPAVATHNNLCPQGDVSSTRTMVVFGDSHAEMWLPALIADATNAGWKLLPVIKLGCLPSRWLSYPLYPNCPPWYRWAIAEITALHPDVVVIAGIDNGGGAWESNLRKTIRTWQAIGTRVILMGDPPPFTVDPTDCLLSRGATMKTCTFPLDPNFANREANAATFGADYIADLPWFCSDGECPMVVGQTITFRDPGHISRAYATELAPALGKALNLNKS